MMCVCVHGWWCGCGCECAFAFMLVYWLLVYVYLVGLRRNLSAAYIINSNAPTMFSSWVECFLLLMYSHFTGTGKCHLSIYSDRIVTMIWSVIVHRVKFLSEIHSRIFYMIVLEPKINSSDSNRLKTAEIVSMFHRQPSEQTLQFDKLSENPAANDNFTQQNVCSTTAPMCTSPDSFSDLKRLVQPRQQSWL